MPTSRIRLYELADELYRLAPWRWMNESQLIVLQRNDSEEKAYLSIMGAAGNHQSLALYLGDEAIHRFNLIHEAAFEGIELGESDMIGLILESRQLQVNFTGRGDLYPAELREIKALGRKYRGDNWVCFRTFRPGFVPDPVKDEAEVEWLVAALEQTLAVASELEAEPFGDYRGEPDGTVSRITRSQKDDGTWETTWTLEDTRLFHYPEPSPSADLVAQVASLPASGDDLALECLVQIIPSPVGRPGKGAVFPYLSMSADAATGFVLGVTMLSVENQSHEEVISSLPNAFLKMWIEYGFRPAALRVNNETTRAILQKTSEALGIPLLRKEELPQLETALRAMMKMMEG